VLIFLTHALTR